MWLTAVKLSKTLYFLALYFLFLLFFEKKKLYYREKNLLKTLKT